MPSKKTSDYAEFVKKFEETAPKTTDDCYTPNAIMDVVNNYVRQRWCNGSGARFVRPFYPGGDYEHYDYPEDCIVVDNPPFSILSKIKRFYVERGIKFFLFAPALTAFGRMQHELTYIFIKGYVTYANGANVNTCFVTNLPSENVVETSTELSFAVDEANKLIDDNPPMPKYEYPIDLITAAKFKQYAEYGVEYYVRKGEALRISRLDAQKPLKKAIFGGGLLISKSAVERRVKADERLNQQKYKRLNQQKYKRLNQQKYVFELSDRERQIQESLK